MPWEASSAMDQRLRTSVCGATSIRVLLVLRRLQDQVVDLVNARVAVAIEIDVVTGATQRARVAEGLPLAGAVGQAERSRFNGAGGRGDPS